MVYCSYEAFVIYTFLSLCLEFVGGPGEVEVKMNGFVLHPSFLHCTCCFPPQRVDGLFVRRCKQGALQFVLLMPILGILSVVLYATGNYSPGYWGPSNGCACCASVCRLMGKGVSGSVLSYCSPLCGTCVCNARYTLHLPLLHYPLYNHFPLCRYLYITIVYNVTYSVALLALFMFYMGAHDLLAPFNPLLKFVLVKSVVFFTFWQVLAARTGSLAPCWLPAGASSAATAAQLQLSGSSQGLTLCDVLGTKPLAQLHA